MVMSITIALSTTAGSAQSSAVRVSRAELSLSITTQGEATADPTARLHTALCFKCGVTEGLSTEVSQWT